MAQKNSLVSDAVFQLQQIRAAINNAKVVLSQLLEDFDQTQNAETTERIHGVYEVLKELKEQERAHTEMLDQYADLQNAKAQLGDHTSATRYAVSTRQAEETEAERMRKLEAIRRSNDMRRAEFAEVVGESGSVSGVTTPSEPEYEQDTESTVSEDYAAARSNGVQASPNDVVANLRKERSELLLELRKQHTRMATLRSYENSLNQLRCQFDSQLSASKSNVTNSNSRIQRDREASLTSTAASASDGVEQMRFPFETDTESEGMFSDGQAAAKLAPPSGLHDRLTQLERRQSEVDSLIERYAKRDAKASAGRKLANETPIMASSRLGSSLVEPQMSTSAVARGAMELTRATRESADITLHEGADLLDMIERRAMVREAHERERDRERREWKHGAKVSGGADAGAGHLGAVHVPPLELPSRSSVATSDDEQGSGHVSQHALSYLAQHKGTAVPAGYSKQTPLTAANSNVQRSKMAAARSGQQRQASGSQNRVKGNVSHPKSAKAAAADDTASNASTSSTATSLSGSSSTRATRRQIREQRRELEEVRARVRRHEALLGSLRHMQAQLAATPGVYTAPELLALTNEIIDEVTDDVDATVSAEPQSQSQSQPKAKAKAQSASALDASARRKLSDVDAASNASSAFASNAESQAETASTTSDSEAPQHAIEPSDSEASSATVSSSCEPFVLSKDRLRAIRRKANLPTDSENASVDDAVNSSYRASQEPTRNLRMSRQLPVQSKRPETKQPAPPSVAKRNQSPVQPELEHLATTVRTTADWCESLARGQQRITSLITNLVHPASATPSTHARTLTPTQTQTQTQSEMFGMLMSMQQQVLAQQCELLQLRQQLTSARPPASPFSWPAATPTSSQTPAPQRMRAQSSEARSFSAFDALRERIYAEVVSLIVANEGRPQYVVDLLGCLRMLRTDEQREHVLRVIHDTALSQLAKETASYEHRLATGRKAPHDDDSESSTSSQRRFLDKLEAIFVHDRDGLYSNDESDASVSTNGTYDVPITSSQLRQSAATERKTGLPERHTTNRDAAADDSSLPTSDAVSESESESGTEATIDRLVNESLRAIDTPLLDAFIKTLISDLIAQLRDRFEEPLTSELRTALRRFIMRSADRLIGVGGEDGFAAFFSRQLDAVLGECLAKYDSRRVRECCEQLLVDVSELLFNEFAFFRVVRNLDDSQNRSRPDQVHQAYTAPVSSLRNAIRDQLLAEPSVPQNSSAVETDEDSVVSSSSLEPPRRVAHILRESSNQSDHQDEPVRIELTISQKKPYLRVVHNDEEGDSDDDASNTGTEADAEGDTDADIDARTSRQTAKSDSEKKYRVTSASRNSGDSRYSALPSQFDSNGALSSSMVPIGLSADEDDADFAALNFETSALQNGAGNTHHRSGSRSDADRLRERSILSKMYDESFSLAESSESEVPPSSDVDEQAALATATTTNGTANVHPNRPMQNGKTFATAGVLSDSQPVVSTSATINGCNPVVAPQPPERDVATSEVELTDRPNGSKSESGNENVSTDVKADEASMVDSHANADVAVSFDELNKDALQEKQTQSQSQPDLIGLAVSLADADTNHPSQLPISEPDSHT